MAENIAIIDYGSGNLRSVQKALQWAARDADIAARVFITADADAIAKADRIVLPGVGAFGAGMDGLRARAGVLESMEQAVLAAGRPFLGICVGMQLLADCGREFGVHDGLGWIAGEVVALPVGDPAYRTPHMGWNAVHVEGPHPVFENRTEEAFYFAHSYHFVPENNVHLVGACHHGVRLAAMVARDNILGVQFHPEKSQTAGLALLRKFLQWYPG